MLKTIGLNAVAFAALAQSALAGGIADPYSFDPSDPPMSVAWYHNPSEEVMRVFGRLWEVLGRFHAPVMPAFLEYKYTAGEDFSYAYSFSKPWERTDDRRKPALGAIVITRELMDSVRNEHELAWHIAHELAHIQFRHSEKLWRGSIAPTPDVEKEADTYAVIYMHEAGFNCKESEGVFRRMFEGWLRKGSDSERAWHESRDKARADMYHPLEERLNLYRSVCRWLNEGE